MALILMFFFRPRYRRMEAESRTISLGKTLDDDGTKLMEVVADTNNDADNHDGAAIAGLDPITESLKPAKEVETTSIEQHSEA